MLSKEPLHSIQLKLLSSARAPITLPEEKQRDLTPALADLLLMRQRFTPLHQFQRSRGKSRMHPKLTVELLTRRAVVYIRQSSPGQVVHNLESQRRQYGLADHARRLGFEQVHVIDEDLGRSSWLLFPSREQRSFSMRRFVSGAAQSTAQLPNSRSKHACAALQLWRSG